MNRAELKNFLTDREYIETIKQDKAELVKSGTFGSFLRSRKEQYAEGFEPSEDPEYYGLTEYEKELCDSLQHSKKNKKKDARQHIWFMHQFYENVGFLTLSFSDSKITSMTFEWMRKKVCEVLSECFGDFYGRPELSKKGRIHFHFIVGWDGPVSTMDVFRDGKKNRLVLNKNDLQELWFGEKDENGQPTKYGIYDLILAPRDMDRTESNKLSNYVMKSLYTMESYITKQDEEDFSELLDDELLYKVNTSNVMVARNTPFQAWKKSQGEQDKFIKHQARIFESAFYEENKYSSKKAFREWAERNKGVLLVAEGRNGEPLYLIPKDYKTIEIDDYKTERLNE